jgi:hypothetical protein
MEGPWESFSEKVGGREAGAQGVSATATAGREREKQMCGVAKGENEDDEVSL